MEICTTMFVVALFTVANRQNHPKQGPIKRCMGKQNVAIYTMEYYSALKEILTHAWTWMNLEDILLSKISQT